MKKIRSLSLIIIFLFLAVWGCNQSNEVEPVKPTNFESPQFIMIDNNDLLNGIEDATLSSEMKFNNMLFNFGVLSLTNNLNANNPIIRGIPWLENFDFTKQLGFIFRRLNLSESQVAETKVLMKAYHESLKPLVKEFADGNKEIVKAANEKRKAILDDLKNGVITRQEANEKIKNLNIETREKIKNNPVSIRIKDQICKLNKKLFNDIKGLLTADQLVKWNEMTKRFQFPC